MRDVGDFGNGAAVKMREKRDSVASYSHHKPGSCGATHLFLPHRSRYFRSIPVKCAYQPSPYRQFQQESRARPDETPLGHGNRARRTRFIVVHWGPCLTRWQRQTSSLINCWRPNLRIQFVKPIPRATRNCGGCPPFYSCVRASLPDTRRILSPVAARRGRVAALRLPRPGEGAASVTTDSRSRLPVPTPVECLTWHGRSWFRR